jgi:hypothetical protein
MEGGVTSSLTTYYPTTTAAYYAPRFDYDPSTFAPLGLLIEEQRTNSIRNNTMQGAVAGTPGTLPTNWLKQSVGGVALTEVVGTGTENGIAYIDVRYTGTTSSTASGGILAEATTQIPASSGQTWASSFYVRLVGGSTAGLTINNSIFERNSGGTLLVSTNTVITPTNAALNTQRVSTTRTLTEATTAFVQQRVTLIPASGVAIDITLRIGLPQFELGAFATSVIPTTTTALTRSADAASMTGTNFSDWFNASEFTVVSSFQRNTTANAASGGGVSVPRIYAFGTSLAGLFQLRLFGATGAEAVGPSMYMASTWGANQPIKHAVAYAVNNAAIVRDGGAAVTDTSVDPFSTAPDMFSIGINTSGTGNIGQGWFQRIAYYPTRLPNATLQALTA